jgi:hypothetical protein
MSPREVTPPDEPTVVGASDRDLERSGSAFFAAHPFDGPTVDVAKLPAARFFDLVTGGDPPTT